MDPDNRIVVLFSGGADSVLMLSIAEKLKKEPYCVIIDYEQLHKQELEFAERFCKSRKIDYQIVKISGLNVDSALTGNGGKGTYEGVSEWVVPGRNTMLLSIALSIAEANGISDIWFGPDWSDREHLFPDCYQEYVYRMNEVFKIQGSHEITITAPLLGMTKEMVVKLLEYEGIKKEDYFSGYGSL